MNREKTGAPGPLVPCHGSYAPSPSVSDVGSSVEKDNGLVINGTNIAQELMEILLSYFELEDILSAALVCKKWWFLVRQPIFWKILIDKAEPGKWQVIHNRLKSHPDEWQVHYSVLQHRTFGRNLIENPCGHLNSPNGLEGWEILTGTPSHWRINSLETDIPVDQLDGEEVPTSCFETSSTSCLKEQYLNLWALGLTPPVMRACIPFSIGWFEFVCTPPHKPGIFEASVTLLDRDFGRISPYSPYEHSCRLRLPGGSAWVKVHHEFVISRGNEHEIVEELKFIRICHGGVEPGNSIENFQGPKFTNTSIKIKLL